jgi:hypothetical protein
VSPKPAEVFEAKETSRARVSFSKPVQILKKPLELFLKPMVLFLKLVELFL